MNEGEPKPKSKVDLLMEQQAAERRGRIEQRLAALDAEALEKASPSALEEERREIADQKEKERADTDNPRAHFLDLEPTDLHPYDLLTALRVRIGEFHGLEGEKAFSNVRAEMIGLLETLEKNGGGPQVSRKVLYAYLGHLFAERGLSGKLLTRPSREE